MSSLQTHKSIMRQAALKHPSFIMPPYDAMLNLDGFDAICTFAELTGGTSIYVPSPRTIFFHCLEEEAAREFNGADYRSLCRKYGFSERHLRRMLSARKG